MAKQEGGGVVPAVARAKAILDLVAQSRQPPGLSEIARHLGLPKSSAHGLCNTLVRLGLLARQGPGGFALGGHVMVWANAFATQSDLIASFLRLHEETPALHANTLTLSTPDGADVVYVATKEGNDPLGLTFRIGMRLPAAFTATGKAVLSTYGEEEIAALYREGLPAPLTRHSVRALDDLRRELAETRRRGYSVDNGQVREGMVCFGAPIIGFASPRAIGGIAISVLEASLGREDEARLGELTRDCAARLSRALGG